MTNSSFPHQRKKFGSEPDCDIRITSTLKRIRNRIILASAFVYILAIPVNGIPEDLGLPVGQAPAEGVSLVVGKPVDSTERVFLNREKPLVDWEGSSVELPPPVSPEGKIVPTEKTEKKAERIQGNSVCTQEGGDGGWYQIFTMIFFCIAGFFCSYTTEEQDERRRAKRMRKLKEMKKREAA